jgi:hypothetical protein
VLVQPGVDLGRAGRVPPVAHQVADDGEERDDGYAGLDELGVCYVADLRLGVLFVSMRVCFVGGGGGSGGGGSGGVEWGCK